jgi:transposase-like protein
VAGPFLDFPPELRKLVYTTNAIESLDARFRQALADAAISPMSRPHSGYSIW